MLQLGVQPILCGLKQNFPFPRRDGQAPYALKPTFPRENQKRTEFAFPFRPAKRGGTLSYAASLSSEQRFMRRGAKSQIFGAV
jgi:hypothetical protein